MRAEKLGVAHVLPARAVRAGRRLVLLRRRRRELWILLAPVLLMVASPR